MGEKFNLELVREQMNGFLRDMKPDRRALVGLDIVDKLWIGDKAFRRDGVVQGRGR